MRGHPLEHDRGTETDADVIRQLHQPFRRRHGELGVGAGKVLRGYPVALTHAGDAGPNLDDRAGRLRARYEGGPHLVEAGALVNLDEVDANGFKPNQRLIRAGGRPLDPLIAQDVGTADLVNSDGLHAGPGREVT